MTLAELTRATFEPLVHARFSMRLGDQHALELELVELQALAGAGAREPFSLVFLGPETPWVEQGTYSVEHPQIGAQPIFIVPLGPNRSGCMQYQAIFS